MKRLLLGLLLLFGIQAFAQEKKAISDAIPGVVIAYFETTANNLPAFIKNFNQTQSPANQISGFEKIGSRHPIYKLYFDPAKTNAQGLLKALQACPEVVTAQFDYQIAARNVPNDPEYEKEWGLQRIEVAEVWKSTTGGLSARGDTIVVAILDNGFDIQHEDLAANVWRNRFDNTGDGIDNDQNGWIDDVNGWNFSNNSNVHTRSTHGTSVAGILGARGNNGIGVTGVNWNIKMMLLTTSKVSEIVSAYEYVIEQRRRYNESNGKTGAFVVATNASFGQEFKFCSEQPVWGRMYDLLGEVGVLTGAGTVNSSVNVEEVGDMPTTCTSDFLITCLNLTERDQIGSSSGYGKLSIDLAAPGDNSYSTRAFNNYGSFGQNSAAAPHLTGAIALLYSIDCEELAKNAILYPQQTALDIRNAILKGVKPLDVLKTKTVTGGVLNVLGSLLQLSNQCAVKTGVLNITNLYPNPASDKITLEYETPDFEVYTIQVFNTLGQLMYRNQVTPPRFAIKREQVNVQNWMAGFYFVVLQKKDQRVFRKFIVR